MLTYLLGPLALFPRRWRKLLPAGSAVEWRRATVLSGFGEAVIALIALMYWYSYCMAVMADHGLDAALTGKLPSGVTDHGIGFAALLIWATHPLTWLIAYAGVEGSVRFLGAAFTETDLGILPLFLLDKIIGKFSGRSEPSLAKAAGYSQVFLLRGRYSREGRGQGMNFALTEAWRMLEIRVCRRKADWNRRARSVSRIAITGWKCCPGAAHRGRFATFCGNCRRV